MSLESGWFTEKCLQAGSAFSLKVKHKLYEEQTPYQLIEIYETETFGKLMTLDGLVMLTDRDNFIYHEMLTHPGLFTHPDPKKVLIIGGGDCGSLREVLKHDDVEHADQVEIDERVTRAAERYFPELCEANGDARAHFHFDDGIKWVARAADESYDVIIVDSTDPVGPAAGLFSPAFYRDCHRALAADGVLIAQSESPLYHLELIRVMHAALRAAGFADAGTLPFPQCSYPSGWWSVTLARKSGAVGRFRETAAVNKHFATRYYNRALHAGALALPAFLAETLASAGTG
jgi:spermidine synthase